MVVPRSAVVRSAQGSYVLVPAEQGDSMISKRPVEVGRTLSDVVLVLSGLHDDESIITGETFFSDAERRLEAAKGQTAEVTR